MKILVTGAAGFIGFHLIHKLLERGDYVIGIDNINDYYDPTLKFDRLRLLGIEKNSIEWNKKCNSVKNKQFQFFRANIEEKEIIANIFEAEKPDRVCHLAAQAGVRYSLKNPYAYIESNILGFLNILEGCRHNEVEHLAYASSSSVYGLNEKMPLSENDNVDHPVSLYAATKKSNELMAHSYSHLYGLPTTGLRFFTVYGPWGRPDMALFLFTKAILENKPINIFNHGNMIRDFTYVGDIVKGIIRVIDNPASSDSEWSGTNPDPATSKSPYRILNIGNHNPINLLEFVTAIEEELGIEAKKNFMDMQPGDVQKTYADTSNLMNNYGYKPDTSIQYGIHEFVKWYREYYGC
jgi:UDP-glucuronate 4-epimerase